MILRNTRYSDISLHIYIDYVDIIIINRNICIDMSNLYTNEKL